MAAEAPPWPPPISSHTFGLRSNTGRFVSPLTGKTQRSVRQGARWEFDVEFYPLETDEARVWRAFITNMQENALSFYWNPYPLVLPKALPGGISVGITADTTLVTADSDGASSGYTADMSYTHGDLVVDGSGQIGNVLAFSGKASFMAFYVGEFIAFWNGRYREMHMLTADVPAGSTSGTFNVVPAIKRSPTDGVPIFIDGNTERVDMRCACEVMVEDNEQAFGTLRSASLDYRRFKLIEVLGA